jgi:hypothetical protein
MFKEAVRVLKNLMLCNYTSLNYYLEVSIRVGKNFKVKYEIASLLRLFFRSSVWAEPSLAVQPQRAPLEVLHGGRRLPVFLLLDPAFPQQVTL